MNIDRVARAMTSGGPADGFTERVMAPIFGRPRPGFTARVMARVDEPVAQTGVRAAFTVAIAAAAVTLFAVAAHVRRDSIVILAPPDAPRLAGNAFDGGAPGGLPPAVDRPSSAAAPRRVRAPQSAAASHPETTAIEPPLPSLRRIAALETPAEISLEGIEPVPPVVPALSKPAPLVITDLSDRPAGSRTSGERTPKETP